MGGHLYALYPSYNRTIEELKQIEQHATKNSNNCYNRTVEELKLMSGEVLLMGEREVIIAP